MLIMKKYGIVLLAITMGLMTVSAQEMDRRAEVIGVIDQLFNGMREADSAKVRATFHPDMRLQTTYINEEGQPQIVTGDIERFVQSVGSSEPGTLIEKIWGYDVQIEQNLASVWTPYSFFVGDKLSHCGVNTFQMFDGPDGWQIIQIADTREREGCQSEPNELEQELDAMITAWHQAATDADADAFFGAMSEDGVYIGTDKSERWLRDELRKWAKDAFDRDTAWEFKAIDRVITIAPDQRHAWWDETLNTWMGVCRSTGILKHTPQGWKITHYQLSVTVPNEKIEDFKELVEN